MRRYKKEEFGGKAKENLLEKFEHDVWDFKKILIGFVILFVLFGGGYYFLKTSHLLPDVSYIFSTKLSHQAVAGISTKQNENANAASSSGSLENLTPQAKLNQLKQEVNNLNVSDMAANSPQVKKLQSDLQTLTNLPKNEAKAECLQICGGL